MRHNRQSGIAKVFLVIGVFFFLGAMVVVLLSIGGGDKDNGSTPQTTDTNNSTSNNSSNSGDSNNTGTTGKYTSRKLGGKPDLTDYTVLTNSSYHFSIGFPKAWGKVSSPGNDATSLSNYHTPTLTNVKLGDSTMRGSFSAVVYPVNSFTVTSQIGGPIVAPTAGSGEYVWRVTIADSTNTYPVGTIFKNFNTIKNTNGVYVYDFPWEDTNGTYYSRLVFANGANTVGITLPGIPNRSSTADKAIYQKLVDNIVNTIQLTN